MRRFSKKTIIEIGAIPASLNFLFIMIVGMRHGRTPIRWLLLTVLFTGGCGAPAPFLTRSPAGPAHFLPPDEPAYIRIPLLVELPGPKTVGDQVAAAFKEGFQRAIPNLTFPA